MVGKWGVNGVNENDEHLVDIGAKRRLLLTKHLLLTQDDPQVHVEKEG